MTKDELKEKIKVLVNGSKKKKVVVIGSKK